MNYELRSPYGTDRYLAETIGNLGDAGDGADAIVRGPFAAWSDTGHAHYEDTSRSPLAILGTLIAHLAERASVILPAAYSADSERAINAVHAAIIATSGTRLMDRSAIIAAMVPDEFLSIDEQQRQLFAFELIDGSPDDEHLAAESVLERFVTTAKLPANRQGEYRMTRRLSLMPVWDSQGNTSNALEARRAADDYLAGRVAIVDGVEVVSLANLANPVPADMRLIGAEDFAPNVTVVHEPDVISQDPELSTEGYWRTRLLKSAVSVGSGKRKVNALYGGIRGLATSVFRGGGQRARATAWQTQGVSWADMDGCPIGRPDTPRHVQIARNGTSLVTVRRLHAADSPALLRELLAPTWELTRPINANELRTTFRGKHLNGHGRWEGRTTRPTTRKARQTRSKVHAASRPQVIQAGTDTFADVVTRTLTSGYTQTFTVTHASGSKLTVLTLKNGQHRLTFKAAGADRAIRVNAGRYPESVAIKVRLLTT